MPPGRGNFPRKRQADDSYGQTDGKRNFQGRNSNNKGYGANEGGNSFNERYGYQKTTKEEGSSFNDRYGYQKTPKEEGSRFNDRYGYQKTPNDGGHNNYGKVETFGEDHAGVQPEEGEFGKSSIRGEFPRELVTYMKEMKNLIKNDADVDANLLMTQIKNNINEEEHKLCLFQESSRLLEELFAKPEDAIHLLSQILRRKKHVLAEILFDGCGSHVLQTMFTRIVGNPEESIEVISRFVDLIADNFNDTVVSRTASFVLRTLGSTCVNLPFEPRRNYRSCLTLKTTKSPKLDVSLRQQFERLAYLVFDYSSMKDYMDNNCVSLVMQDFAYYDTIAKTSISNQYVMDFLQKSEEEFTTSLKSSNASRVWDVLMATIKDDLRGNIFDLVLSNNLYNIAKDDRARFCIEVFISSAKEQELIENIVDELADNIDQLLSHRREVIVSAMVNAVSRHSESEIQQRVFEPMWTFYGEDIKHVLSGKPGSDTTKLGPESWNLTGIILAENVLKIPSTPLQKQLEAMSADELIVMADHVKARFVLDIYFAQKHIEEKDKVALMQKFQGRLVDLLSLRNTGAVFRSFWKLPMTSKETYDFKYSVLKELVNNFGLCHTKSWRSVMEELDVLAFRNNEIEWLKKNNFPKEFYKKDGPGKHGKGKNHFKRK